MKKLLYLFFISIVLIPSVCFAKVANPNNDSKMEIVGANGSKSEHVFSTYNIDDYNYFKLRNLATYMNDTSKSFDVVYNEDKNSIEIKTNKKYSNFNADTFSERANGVKDAVISHQSIFIDGKEVKLNGYNIDGYNYFKLRDLANVLNFNVGYDEARKVVILDANNSYKEERVTKPSNEIKNGNLISDKVLGENNTYCYIAPRSEDASVKVVPGYVALVKNNRIVSFKECGDVINIPKNTGVLYMNYSAIKNNTVNIDNVDTKVTNDYLNKWMKNGYFVPVVLGHKADGFNGVVDITYVTFVNLNAKYENVTQFTNAPYSKFYKLYSYEAIDNYVKYLADRADVYNLAEKGINIGYSWYRYNIPKKHSEKLEQMIHYALSVQGFRYEVLDCSGLVSTSAELAGFEIAPAYTWTIEHQGSVYEVPMKDLKRGDLLNKAGSHIMIYLGDGKVVESVPGAGVRVAKSRTAGYKALRLKEYNY